YLNLAYLKNQNEQFKKTLGEVYSISAEKYWDLGDFKKAIDLYDISFNFGNIKAEINKALLYIGLCSKVSNKSLKIECEKIANKIMKKYTDQEDKDALFH